MRRSGELDVEDGLSVQEGGAGTATAQGDFIDVLRGEVEAFQQRRD